MRTRPSQAATPGAADARQPPRLRLARLPTPFEPLDRLSALVGGARIWVKRDDLSDCAVSGNKIRKLEFTIAQALEDGADTLLTCGGLQSNHCRATALLGARLGVAHLAGMYSFFKRFVKCLYLLLCLFTLGDISCNYI